MRPGSLAALLVQPLVVLAAPTLRADPTWSPPLRLSGVEDRESIHPCLAAGPGGRLHLVWREAWTDGQLVATRIAYRRQDGGSWLAPDYLSAPGRPAHSPWLAVDALGQPHVVWLERGVSASGFLVRYSFRPGQGWRPPEQVSASDEIGFEGHPRVAILPEGDPLVLWADDRSLGNPEVFWNRRGPAGWAGAGPLSALDEYLSGGAGLVPEAGGGPVAFWLDRRREGHQPFLRRFEAGRWSVPIPIGEPASSFVNPQLVLGDEGRLDFFYSVREGLAVRSADPMMLWEDSLLLPTAVPYPSFNLAPVDGATVLLAYRDQVGAQGVLFAREFSVERQGFTGLPSVVAPVVVSSLGLSLAVGPSGERSLAWSDVPPHAREEAVFHSVFRDLPRPRFRRGDLEGLGLDLSDPVGILVLLFLGGGELACAAAADADADGLLNVTDPIYLLVYLFQAGPPPAPPFPDCGVDQKPPLLTCQEEGCR